MKYSDIIKIVLTKDEILLAIDHAKNEKFLDNLRDRKEFVAFDSKVRGYIGELYLKKIFIDSGINILRVDYSIDGFETDVDFEVENRSGKSLRIECKTSLVPDVYGSIRNSINHCDIKIIKREKDYRLITTDIHVQIYFDELRKQRDKYLLNLNDHVISYSNDELFSLLKLNELTGYFVAWIDRDSLNSYLGLLSMNERIWNFGYRSFWKCPLSFSSEPGQLISYLKK